MTASERLADHVVGLRFEDIPASAVERVKDLLVEHIAVAFRGVGTDRGRWAIRLASELSAGGEQATIIGERGRANVLDAILANATLISGENLDDFLFPGGIHAGRIVFPAALAFGELESATGRDLISAVVVGYDAMAKLSNAVWAWGARAPRRAQAPFAPFGAAAAAARILGLDRERAAHALGHAAHFGMGLIEDASRQWPLQGMLARNGATAALAARAGALGSSTAIDGPRGLFMTFFEQVPAALDNVLGTLGREFEVMRTSLKRYPGSGFNVIPQQLMHELVRTHAIRGEEIASVTITLPEARRERETVMEREYETGPRANGSVRFLLSAVAVQGEIDPAAVAKEDARVGALRERASIAFEMGHPIRFARVEVRTTNGQRYSAEADDHAFPPIDRGVRLRQHAPAGVSAQQLERAERMIASLEGLKSVTELMACVVPERS